MGLKVVTTSGSPPTLGASMLRNLLRFADFLPFGYLFGVVTCLSNRNFQRIGDLVADTLVVYDAKPAKDEKALLLKNLGKRNSLPIKRHTQNWLPSLNAA